MVVTSDKVAQHVENNLTHHITAKNTFPGHVLIDLMQLHACECENIIATFSSFIRNKDVKPKALIIS